MTRAPETFFYYEGNNEESVIERTDFSIAVRPMPTANNLPGTCISHESLGSALVLGLKGLKIKIKFPSRNRRDSGPCVRMGRVT